MILQPGKFTNIFKSGTSRFTYCYIAKLNQLLINSEICKYYLFFLFKTPLSGIFVWKGGIKRLACES